MVTTLEKPQTLSLENFLSQPETQPASEYVNGIITEKPMPKEKHSTLQFELLSAINQQTKPKKMTYALPELRCTFSGRSIVPDTALLITMRDSKILSLPYLPFLSCPRWIPKTLYCGYSLGKFTKRPRL